MWLSSDRGLLPHEFQPSHEFRPLSVPRSHELCPVSREKILHPEDLLQLIWRIRSFETTSRQFRNYRPVISKLPAFFTLHTPFLAIIFFWFPNYVLRFSLDSKLPTGSFESTRRQFRNYRLVASKLPALSFDTTSLQLRNYQPVASKLKFNSFDTTER